MDSHGQSRTVINEPDISKLMRAICVHLQCGLESETNMTRGCDKLLCASLHDEGLRCNQLHLVCSHGSSSLACCACLLLAAFEIETESLYMYVLI